MPTSVGPNTFGEENLVFGYDTGDTVNSYRGEPTTIYGEPFPTETTLPTGFYWGYEYDHEIVDAPISGHFLSNKKWIKSTRDTTGSRRVLFINNSFTAGRTYTFSCYAYSTDTNLTSLSHVSHNGGYSSTQNVTSYGTADLGRVKRIHGTWIQQVNGGPIFGMQTNDAALGTTFYMTGFQVEEKTRATQLTGDSRSATQGLIDLTGNSTIDLTNVSFGSNAQMTFDGTDDRILIPEVNVPDFTQTDSFTIEVVGSYQTQSSSGMVALVERYTWGDANKGGYSLRLKNYSTNYPEFYVGSNNSHAGASATSVTVVQGQKYHIVGTFSNGNIKIYVNGELKGTATTSASYPLKSQAGKELAIGVRGDTQDQYSEQDIDVAKLYNKALTASEIKANYNAIKGRFNI